MESRCGQAADRSRPTGSGATGGVLPAVLALAGAGLVAVLLHQPMFLIFGAIGAIVAFGTWGGQRISLFHRRRRDARDHQEEMLRFEAAVDSQRDAFVAHHRCERLDTSDGEARRSRV